MDPCMLQHSLRQRKAYRHYYAVGNKMKCFKKSFGQICIDYLGPKNYNLMPVNIKREICYTEGNRIT